MNNAKNSNYNFRLFEKISKKENYQTVEVVYS